MILALISVSVMVATGYLIFKDTIPENNKIAGMLIGCYTGGTINMAALAVALNVEPNAFIMTNTYDMIVGALTILFFITAGPAVFRKLSPAIQRSGSQNADADRISIQQGRSWQKSSMIFQGC